ncbi:hypothetical protein [Haploplasma modicum]|uniref:hypothetical protein n=1 Tax=Haploplasma modicum TaxID=2150 RepID=UPI00138ABAEA|nr:hypothetical protein [Haploplasma modicum]
MDDLNCRHYDEIILKDEKTLTVFLMLQSGQKVNYDIFYDYFESSRRTFNRVIATIRSALYITESNSYVKYCKETDNYALVKVL